MNYNQYLLNGIKIHIASDDISNLRLLQTRDTKYPLSQYFYNGKKPNTIINCSYFTSTYVIGRNQGDISQSTSSYIDKGWLGFALKEDMSYISGELDWCDVEKSICGFTPAVICIKDGKKVEMFTKELASSYSYKMGLATAVTFFGILKDKKTCLFATAEKGISGTKVANYLITFYDFDFLCELDGGGSSEMIVNGTIKQKSTDGSERKMFNGLAFIENEKQQEQKEDEIKVEKKILDISTYQGTVDFAKMKANCDGVILRLGFTGYGSNKPALDSKFEEYYKGLHNVGCPIGIYYFTLAQSEAMADAEAKFILEQVKNKEIKLPIYIDCENQKNSSGWTNLTKVNRTKYVKRLCQAIQNEGYYVGIYANLDWLVNKLDMSELQSFDVWFAQYSTKPTYTGKFNMWQYTSSGDGKLHGVSTDKIDISKAYVDFVEVIKNSGLNHLDNKSDEIAELNKTITALKDMNNALDKAVKERDEIIEKIKELVK